MPIFSSTNTWDSERQEQTWKIIQKPFVRPHFDYCDIIYDEPKNESSCKKLDQVQYNAALAINGTTRGTSQTKLCNSITCLF